MLTHSGSTFGYRAYITLIPDKQLGIFTAMTGDDPKYFYRMSLHSYLLDLYLEKSPWLNQTTICSFPEPWNPNPDLFVETSSSHEQHVPKRELSSYVGTYRHGAYGEVTVFHNKTIGKLMLTMGFASFNLEPDGGDTFIARGVGLIAQAAPSLVLEFKPTHDGTMSLQIPKLDIDNTKIFQKLVASRASSATKMYGHKLLFVALFWIILSAII